MKTFTTFLNETVNGNLIEYLTRQVFKTKNLKRAVNKVYKDHNGTQNIFLGGDVSFTVEELTDAYYRDKASTIKASLAKAAGAGNDAKAPALIDSYVQYFCLDPDVLKTYLE